MVKESASTQYMLGLKYYFGKDVLKDLNKSKYWLKKASENGSIRANKFMKENEDLRG